METYHYITHSGTEVFDAENDEKAMSYLHIIFGEHLRGLIICFVKEADGGIRTVWLD